MNQNRVQPTPPECALAAEMFDHFCSAGTMKQILALHREICNILTLKPTRLPDFYPKLKAKLSSSWKAQALFKKFDARANHKVYNKGKACINTRVLIIGAGPCGLRAAIECQLLGAKVVVIEKRDRMSRNNVLHLWPFVIHDLRALGAKKFFGKFCAGSIDHISIRQLQCILLKVALLLGVEFHEGVGFEDLLEPTVTENNERLGWRARFSPPDHPVSQYEFDTLIGADGKRNTLRGFKRKEFRGKLAIAITANFINRHSEQEASVQEISGVAFIFNQKFFKDLYRETGIDLENIVYYKDDTHYFVMTAKKHSLIDKGVILKDYTETSKLLSNDNIDREALMNYAKEAADFSTDGRLPNMDFALNHYGEPDVAVFDFTSMYAAENASMVVERLGKRLLVCLVGDSLLEPFWPTGSGCARGFLSALDAAWAVRTWGVTPSPHPLMVVAERESIYRLLGQTTPENLQRDFGAYTLEPSTRYPNLNKAIVTPHRVTSFYDSDDPLPLEASQISTASRKRRRESSEWTVSDEALISWLERAADVTLPHNTTGLKEACTPKILAALLKRYRPDLLVDDEMSIQVLQESFGITSVGSPSAMARGEGTESKLRAYLVRVYRAFRGEVPHIHHESSNIRQQIQNERTERQNMHHEERKSETGRRSRKRRSLNPQHGLNALDGENRIQLRGIGGGATVARLAAELTAGGANANTQDYKLGKPRDLLRAVGKIDTTDWNVREINKKIHENRLGRPQPKGAEKVPKWDREQFLARTARLTEGREGEDDERWNELNETLRKLDRKLRDSGRPDMGTNKVANLKDRFVKKSEPEVEKLKPEQIPGKAWTPAATDKVTTAVINCASCGTRVFAAEGVIADGLHLHKACFRCAICKAVLRPGNYTMERWGNKLVCQRHALETTSNVDGGVMTSETPERIGLEVSQGAAREMDEDEWTDRNFLPSETSGAGGLSDDESSSSQYSEATGKLTSIDDQDKDDQSSIDDPQNDNDRDVYLSEDSFGYDDFSDDGMDSESCSMERKAREQRRLEVPPPGGIPFTTDSSEVESDESSDEDSETSSGTEVSTDSEFAQEDNTPAPLPPSITVTGEINIPSPTPPTPPTIIKSKPTTDYPLSRTRSAGGIATKRALELKKKYLLGEQTSPIVRKSESTSQLDTKFESFRSNISEFQKLLNPAVQSTQPQEKQTSTPNTPTPAPMPDIIQNLSDTTLDLIAEGEAQHTMSNPVLSDDPLSKITDISEITEVESDSLSGSDSSTAEAAPKSTPIPRVEIHDVSGELMQMDSLTIADPTLSSSQDKGTVLEKVNVPLALQDSESSESVQDPTTQGLTETELSDWANDMGTLGDCAELDDLAESKPKSRRKLSKPTTLSGLKNVHDAKNVTLLSEHVCGKESDAAPMAYSEAADNFEFADVGSQESIVEYLQSGNRGYLEFVDNDEYVGSRSPVNDRSMNFIESRPSEVVASVECVNINLVEDSSQSLPHQVDITPTCENVMRREFSTPVPKEDKKEIIDCKNEKIINLSPIMMLNSNKITKSESTPIIKCDPLTPTSSDINYSLMTPTDTSSSVTTPVFATSPFNFSSCSSSFDKSAPLLSKSPSTFACTPESSLKKVEELKRERELETEVVRRLVMDSHPNLQRKSTRRQRLSPPPPPRLSIHQSPPSVTPSPIKTSRPSSQQATPTKEAQPRGLGPSFSDPELATSRRRRGIIRTVSAFFNRRLGPRSKWSSEPSLNQHESSRSSGHALSEDSSPPPIPPPPAHYVAEQRAAQLEDAIRKGNSDEVAALEDWFTAKRAAAIERLKGREAAAKATDIALAQRDAKLRRKLRRALSPEEEAATVAELLQLSSRREALAALHAQDRKRQATNIESIGIRESTTVTNH